MDSKKHNFDYIITDSKIYKIRAIQIAAFLGGPLIAGYLIAENYKALNETHKVKVTWLITAISTAVIFIIAISIPASSKFPSILLPLVYSWIAFYLAQQYQGAKIDGYIDAGGRWHSWWRIIGVSLIGLAVTFILAFLFIICFTAV